MKEQVKNKIEQFIKQLTKSTKNIERQSKFILIVRNFLTFVFGSVEKMKKSLII